MTAQSPFLPDTNIQFAWDSTSLGWLKTCPRLYQYCMIDCYGSSDESVHLRFGIEFHQTLQEYDIAKAKGAKHEEAVRICIGDMLKRTAEFNPDRETKAGKYKNRDSLLRLSLDYLDHYSDDPAQTLILADGTPAVELSFRFELDYGPEASGMGLTLTTEPAPEEGFVDLTPAQPYILCGHLDRVVTFADHLFVMDRKTTMTTPGPYYFNQFEPHNQMSLYTVASQVILNSPVKGVIIDAAQILVDSSRFVRGFTYRTPDQIEEWLKDLSHWLALAEHYASANYWPQNDTACDKFGGCRFREACSKSPGVRNNFIHADFATLSEDARWNPLKSR